jgi:hypothetical protein
MCHSILLEFIIQAALSKGWKLRRFLLCDSFHPITSSLVDPLLFLAGTHAGKHVKSYAPVDALYVSSLWLKLTMRLLEKCCIDLYIHSTFIHLMLNKPGFVTLSLNKNCKY